MLGCNLLCLIHDLLKREDNTLIVKKLFRHTLPSFSNAHEVRDCLGYFLFGLIPLYVVVLDAFVASSDDDGKYDYNVRYGVYMKYADTDILYRRE